MLHICRGASLTSFAGLRYRCSRVALSVWPARISPVSGSPATARPWSPSGSAMRPALRLPGVFLLLYIVKRLGVLFWVGCRVYPLDGPLLEFGKVACAAFDLADAARGHAERLADLLLGDVPADA